MAQPPWSVEMLIDWTKDWLAHPTMEADPGYLRAILTILALHKGEERTDKFGDVVCACCGAIYGKQAWDARQQTLIGGPANE